MTGKKQELPMITERDIDVLARTVYGEARGESTLGKKAVAHVIINRARLRKSGIAAAALKSIHFSAWNNGRGNDVNQLAMLTADLGDSVYRECMYAALAAVRDEDNDPTRGATHYHTRGVSPAWAEGKSYESIGGHLFYRNID